MKYKIGVLLGTVAAIAVALWWYLSHHTVAVLQSAGFIGAQERRLFFIGLLLSAIIIIPVYILTIAIVVRYREENHQRKKVSYSPDFDRSTLLEVIWWGIPIIIITILSVITWTSSHVLDPYRPISSNVKPLNIQVVALDWKWLFIYPDQGVASVNIAEVPTGTPLNLTLTSDTVMNSFWVPQLGGQIYAMPGMSTRLHLVADKIGAYYGSPANIAGTGFARMTFTVQAVSTADFTSWMHHAQQSSKHLNVNAYKALAVPSQDNPVAIYAHVTPGLYNWLMMQYTNPGGSPGAV